LLKNHSANLGARERASGCEQRNEKLFYYGGIKNSEFSRKMCLFSSHDMTASLMFGAFCLFAFNEKIMHYAPVNNVQWNPEKEV
jgi:hypothetical protein